MIEPLLIQQGSANDEVPFVLRCTIGGGGSSTEDLINYSKSKQKNIPRTGRDPISNCEKGNESI